MVSRQINEALLDEKLALLEAARSWSPRVISRLENMIFSEDDEALFRINPLQFATDKRMSESEAIDLFLYGTKQGLFEMDWHIICAFCGNLMSSFRELANLHPHFVCNVCSAKNDLALDNYIQVSFTISPQIRQIIFHDPQSLSIEDYIFKYHLAKGIVTPEGWPSYDEIIKSQFKAMSYIESGEKKAFDFEIEPGILMVRVMDNDKAGIFMIGEDASADQCTIQARLVEGQLHFPHLIMKAQDIPVGGALFNFK